MRYTVYAVTRNGDTPRKIAQTDNVRNAIRAACREQPYSDRVIVYETEHPHPPAIIGEWKRVHSHVMERVTT